MCVYVCVIACSKNEFYILVFTLNSKPICLHHHFQYLLVVVAVQTITDLFRSRSSCNVGTLRGFRYGQLSRVSPFKASASRSKSWNVPKRACSSDILKAILGNMQRLAQTAQGLPYFVKTEHSQHVVEQPRRRSQNRKYSRFCLWSLTALVDNLQVSLPASCPSQSHQPRFCRSSSHPHSMRLVITQSIMSSWSIQPQRRR